MASSVFAAAIPLAVTSAGPADAQYFPFFGYYERPAYRPRPPKRMRARPAPRDVDSRRESKADAKTSTKAEQKKPEGPVTILISINKQRMGVYDKTGQIASAPISTGQRGYPTPTGVFSILQKNRIHFSNLYDSAPMPFMQRITWSGVAMHAGHLPGYPASHGCIRLPYSFAQRLFGMTKMGGRVIVSREELEPLEISHDRLLKPLPPGEPLQQTPVIASAAGDATGGNVAMLIGVSSAEAKPAEQEARTREAVAAAREAEITQLGDAIGTAETNRTLAAERVTTAAQAAEDAKQAVRAARLDAELALKAVVQANEAISEAERRFAAEMSKVKKSSDPSTLDPADLESGAARESEHEDEIFQLIAEADRLRTEAEPHRNRIAEAAAAADAAQRAKDEAEAALDKAATGVKAAQAALESAKRASVRRAQPISVFVSRKTGRLYARQGWEPVLDLPVTIENPDLPLGTHVYTTLGYTADETAMKWNVVSPAYAPEPKPEGKKRKGKTDAEDAKVRAEPPSGHHVPQTAQAALDRVTLPPQALDMIAEVLKPGSSLIISDNPPSSEMGRYTDFIVSLR